MYILSQKLVEDSTPNKLAPNKRILQTGVTISQPGINF